MINTKAVLQGASEKFSEWSQKMKETRVTDKIPLLVFKTTLDVKLLEIVNKCFLWNLSKHRCHALFDIRNVCEA